MSIEKKHDSIMNSLDGALHASIDFRVIEKEGGSIYDHPEYDTISDAVMELLTKLSESGMLDAS